MNIHDFFRVFVRSFNPDSYRHLKERKLKEAFSYFFSLLFITMIISLVFVTPKLVHVSQTFREKISAFDTFNISFDVKANVPITLIDDPLVVVDLDAKELDKEDFLITNDYIFYKEVDPSVKNLSISGEKKIALADYKDLIANNDRLGRFVNILVVILIPSLFLVSYIFLAIKYLGLALLLSVISYMIFRLKKTKRLFRNILKVALFSSSLIVLVDLTIGLYIDLSIITLVIYALFFFASAILSGSTKRGH